MRSKDGSAVLDVQILFLLFPFPSLVLYFVILIRILVVLILDFMHVQFKFLDLVFNLNAFAFLDCFIDF